MDSENQIDVSQLIAEVARRHGIALGAKRLPAESRQVGIATESRLKRAAAHRARG
jgi:hypothetical protein